MKEQMETNSAVNSEPIETLESVTVLIVSVFVL